MPRRVLGYARVSSEEQAKGSSLQDQQDAIRVYAAAKRLDVTRFYVEAESAVHEKIERREQIQALLRDVKKGDLVLCDKLDRWSRDPEFTYRSVRELLAAGASFYAVGDAIDASTPEGDTALGFRILFAREEHKRIKQRMVGTRKLLRERGYYVEGLPPFGYRRAHGRGYRGTEKNVLVVVPEEADLIRRVFNLYIGGMSMNEVGRKVEKPLYFIKRILDRRIYVGEIETSKGWIRGTHEAIVDARTFTRARASAEERRLGGPRPRGAPSETDDWILRDVAVCGRCSARMAAAYAGAKDARRYYYRCAHRCQSKGNRATNGSFVPVEIIEDEAAVLVGKRLVALRAELAQAPEPAAPKKDFEAARAKLQKKRARLQDMYADEAMTREELRAAMVKLDAERLRLDAEEGAPEPLSTGLERRRALAVVRSLKGAWSDAEGPQRRRIVNLLAVDFALLAREEPVPRWRRASDLDFEAIAAVLVGE